VIGSQYTNDFVNLLCVWANEDLVPVI